MHNTTSAPTALQALYRVFVQPALSPSTLQRTLQPKRLPPTRRRFSSTPQTQRAPAREPEKRTQKWDHEITSRTIALVDPDTGKMEETPRLLHLVLAELDLTTHRLIQVTTDGAVDPPVCKIVNKQEYFESQKRYAKATKAAKRFASRASDEGMKRLEINWAIEGGDLGHRVERLKGFLGEGRRVEVLFAAKKRGRKATEEECRGLLQRVGEAVGSVEGAKEKVPIQGPLGGMAKIVYQGPPRTEIAGHGKAEEGKAEEGKTEEGKTEEGKAEERKAEAEST